MNRPRFATALRSSFLVVAALTAACTQAPVTSQGQPVTLGTTTVTVSDARLEYLTLEGPTGAVRTSEPHYVVDVSVANNGTAPLAYDLKWGTSAPTQADAPLLFTAPAEGEPMTSGTHVPATMLSSFRLLSDPVTATVSVGPGETLNDVLVFDAPPAQPLLLSLPPGMFGAGNELPAYVQLPAPAGDVAPPAPAALGETVTLPGVEFTVTSVETAWARLRQQDGKEGYSAAPLLHVRFRLANTGETTREFIPLEANRSLDAPTLRTADGTAIGRAEFPQLVTSVERPTARQQVGATEVHEGVLLFERPAQGTSELVLRVPGQRLGTTGLAEVALPYAWADPARPADLEPQVVDAPAPE